ncbi:CAAX amino terminal protease family protein [Ancylostoma duodenale]|uniref:CAAX prenyl protease 2 n=1 Tax=Ancylostoma duodenale TaxID=51022 RepID=A0A0C2C7A9_9BILA|nr:CAAX amino terminal protease family protein [Ancylostoma duodenale]
MGCGASISLAVLFPLSYVGLLHIADHDGTDRNDPRSIRKRFIAASVNNVLSVAITYAVLSQRGDPFPLRSMGFRAEGTAAATILPAVLVTVLYTGQWMMMYLDGHLWSNFLISSRKLNAMRKELFLALSEWRASFNRPTWIRDAIMVSSLQCCQVSNAISVAQAPITEEIAFRCCCASLLSGCLSPLMTVIVCPLPFASSHFHHIGDDRRRGFSLSQAIARRNEISTMLLKNFHLGAFAHRYQRVLLWTAYTAGMCGFMLLVGPLTRSELYQGW